MRFKSVYLVLFCLSFAFCASAQKKAQQANAKDPKYQYNVGLVYLNQSNVDPKNIDEAIRYFTRCLSLDPRYYLAYNAIGLAQSLKGNVDEAAKAYEKCLEINPQFAEAHNNLGMIYQETNQLDKAESEFKKALLDPTSTAKESPYYNLARLYVVEGRLDEADESARNAIRIQPRMAMAHNLLGLILEKQDKLPQAVAAYEQAVRIVPDDVLFNYNLGAAYFKTEEYAKAKEAFLKISPRVTDPDMRDNITKFLKIIGDKGYRIGV
jgi:protein O-GlcNAc transferase